MHLEELWIARETRSSNVYQFVIILWSKMNAISFQHSNIARILQRIPIERHGKAIKNAVYVWILRYNAPDARRSEKKIMIRAFPLLQQALSVRQLISSIVAHHRYFRGWI